MDQFLSYKQGQIRFRDQGSGPAVIFLHGFLESLDMWEEYTGRLSKAFRVISIDLPGHGQSDCLGYVHPMEVMAEAVKFVLDSLHLRRYIFIGHSMGGYVALAFADRYPDQMKGLCLFFSTARADTDQKKRDRARAIELVKENHRSFIRKAIPLLFRPKNRKLFHAELKALKAKALQTSKQGVIASLEGMKIRPNREVILRFAPCPIFILAGKHDSVIPLETLEPQMLLSENGTGMVIEDCGHMGFIEAKEDCFMALSRFLRSC